MASITSRSGRFRCQVLHRGVRVGQTFDTREDAEFWAARTKAKMQAGWLPDVRSPNGRRREGDNFILPDHFKVPILTEAQIIALSLPYERVCAVYLLICNDKIVYVGQSEDVHARISCHRRLNFDRVTIIRCTVSELNMLEAIYVTMFAPEFNRGAPSACLPTKYARAMA